MTWDAACHALIGLDILDHLRRFEFIRLVVRLEDQRWWPPLFGVLSLPAYLIGGRRLSSPSLVSFASYCLLPAIAWLAVRRVSRAVPLLGWALVAMFFLRSPALIEMSTWSMLELAASLFAMGSLCCFLAGPQSRARNWAYALAGLSFLLKYHYGFFLLVTLTAATLAELQHDEWRAVIAAVQRTIRRRSTWIIVIAAASTIVARRIAETRSAHPVLPSTANVIWLTYITVVIAALVVWARTRRPPWGLLPTAVRRLITFGFAWPLAWLLDPGNVRAWLRELSVTTDPPARWIDQIRIIDFYTMRDYSLGSTVLAVALIGVVLAAIEGVRRRHVGLLALTLHALWPAALMSFSHYAVETRFLATPAVCLYASGAAGWVLFLERFRAIPRIAFASALVALLIVDQTSRTAEWNRQLASRRVYGYASSEAPDAFVKATVSAFLRGQPVVIILPRTIAHLSPTIRLGLRLPMPDVGPDDVEVDGGDIESLAKRLHRFRGGMVGIDSDPATLRRVIEENHLRLVNEGRGPALPDDSHRSLLIATVAAN